MLAEERTRLHPLPTHPHTVAFGVTRTVAAKTPMVAFDGSSYSVPHLLLGQTVWVRGPWTQRRRAGDHRARRPGSPRLNEEYFPPAPAGALNRKPKARNEAELEFLTLGDGARLWLTEAAAAGTTKVWVKMAQAVSLAKLFSPTEVDWALGHAAVHSRFAEADLASILDHHMQAQKFDRRAGNYWRRAWTGTRHTS